MNWAIDPLLIPLVLGAAICVALAQFVWNRRQTAGAYAFVALLLALAFWFSGFVLRLAGGNGLVELLWLRLATIITAVVAYSWLLFALQYARREIGWSQRRMLLLGLHPLATAVLAWTSELHGLMWHDLELNATLGQPQLTFHFGPYFWFQAIISLLYAVAGTLILHRSMGRGRSPYARQLSLLNLGVIGPLLTSLAEPLASGGTTHADLTPFAYLFGILVVAWTVRRYPLFELVPLRLQFVADSIIDPLLVLDAQGRVADANLAASTLFGRPVTTIVGQTWQELSRHAGEGVPLLGATLTEEREVDWPTDAGTRRIVVQISPISDQHLQLAGYVVNLRDVTARWQSEQALVAQTRFLQNLVAVGRATAEHSALEETLHDVLDVAVQLTGADGGSLFTLDENGAVKHGITASGRLGRGEARHLVGTIMNKGLAGWVVANRQAAMVADTARDERWLQATGDSAMCSVLVIPFVSEEDVLGVLTLHHHAPNHFTQSHYELMLAAAEQMALALRNALQYDVEKRRAVRRETLYRVLQTVGRHLDPEAVLSEAVAALAGLTGWPSVAVVVQDAAPNRLLVKVAGGRLSGAVGLTFPTDRGITGRAFLSGKTVYVPDVSQDETYVPGHSLIRSELAVPLRYGTVTLGVLDIESEILDGFEPEDIRLAESLGEALSLALTNAQLYENMRQYGEEFSALYTVASTTNMSLKLHDILNTSLTTMIETLRVDAGVVYLPQAESGELVVAAQNSALPALAASSLTGGAGAALARYVFDQTKPLVVSSLEASSQQLAEIEEAQPQVVAELRAAGIQSFSALPLLYLGQPLGSIVLFATSAAANTGSRLGMQVTISQQVASAVNTANLFETIENERSRLDALISSSRDGIMLISPSRRVPVINRRALELLDLEGTPQEWQNSPLETVLAPLAVPAPEQYHCLLHEVCRASTQGEGTESGDLVLGRRNVHWFNLPVEAPAAGAAEAEMGRLIVLQDVTEERAVARMRDDLTHMMVHDLRNPLNAISAAAEMMGMMGGLGEDEIALLDIAQASALKMRRLVDDILDISRLEAGSMPIEQQAVELVQVAQTVLNEVSPLAREQNISLINAVPASLPPAFVDANLIERVLRNLTGNAIKFTPNGGTISIEAQEDANRPGHLLVCVRDNGFGIPADALPHLFEKFITGRQKQSGSGLGLTFCRMAVNAHGEEIWVESEEGKGTTMLFHLPLVQQSQPAPAALPQTTAA